MTNRQLSTIQFAERSRQKYYINGRENMEEVFIGSRRRWESQRLSRSKRQYQRRAFTLVELLIVILVLSILMAVALPLYLAAIANSQRAVCRANMQSIADAEQAYRARTPTHTYTTTLSGLDPDLWATPVCPESGSYTVEISDGTSVANNGSAVPSGGLLVKCSTSVHGVYAPSIDSE
jgi:type IV pilus assembly protein PilA